MGETRTTQGASKVTNKAGVPGAKVHQPATREVVEFDPKVARQNRKRAVAALSAADAERFTKLAVGLLSDEDIEGALAAAEVAVSCDPQSFLAWSALGTAAARAKQFSRAATAFLRAAEQKPEDVSSWTDAGECYLQLADYHAASDCLRQAMENDPEAKHPSGRRARALVGRTIALLKR